MLLGLLTFPPGGKVKYSVVTNEWTFSAAVTLKQKSNLLSRYFIARLYGFNTYNWSVNMIWNWFLSPMRKGSFFPVGTKVHIWKKQKSSKENSINKGNWKKPTDKHAHRL